MSEATGGHDTLPELRTWVSEDGGEAASGERAAASQEAVGEQQWSEEDWQQWNRGLWVGEAKDTLGLIRPLGEARWLVVPALCLQQRPQQIQRLEILGWTTTHGRDRAGLGIRSRARTIGGAPRQRVIMLTPHHGRVGALSTLAESTA